MSLLMELQSAMTCWRAVSLWGTVSVDDVFVFFSQSHGVIS